MTETLCCQIDDGYTIDVFIKGVRGQFPDVRLSYRPVTPPERVQVFRDTIPEDERFKRIVGALARNVKRWNAKDVRGNVIPCNDQNSFRRLPLALYDRIF